MARYIDDLIAGYVAALEGAGGPEALQDVSEMTAARRRGFQLGMAADRLVRALEEEAHGSVAVMPGRPKST